jgi:hypothetical protein
MRPAMEDPAQQYLELIAERDTCGWCKHPREPIFRCGLCRHCYGIKSELKRRHRDLEGRRARGPVHPTFGLKNLEWPYAAAIDMAEAAQWEGREYGSLVRGEDPLDLEHEFGFICRKLLRKDLYRNSAGLFTHFSPPQRRLLLYLLSWMSRGYLRRKRRRQAWYNIQKGRTLEQALKERLPGTYRVEDDPAVTRRRSPGKPRRRQPPLPARASSAARKQARVARPRFS